MTWLDDVEKFHRRYGFPVNVDFEIQSDFRRDLDDEESREFWDAHSEKDKVHAALELADRIFVLLGHAIQWDLDINTAWEAVNVSNMTKIPNSNGGKPQKPPGWVDPETLFRTANFCK